MVAAERTQPDTRTLILLAFSATAGVMVEFYDFFLYGYAAASAFPAIFFPGLPATQALVLSYLAFGAGFPARLAGAFLFGHFGDRVGRKAAFIVNIAIVGVTTCLTALLPGCATIGIAAPILLVLLRIAQGIGLGGEFGGASALLAEFGAARKHRAFWTSLANLGIPLGGMSASAALLLFHDSFATTGWRVAMLLSVVIVIPALLARYRLSDSPMFARVRRREELSRAPSLSVLRTHAAPIVLLALVSAFQQMDGYVSGTYVISFMNLAGIPLATVASLLLFARVADALGVAASGPCADYLGRKPATLLAIVITTALSYPYVLTILGRQTTHIAAYQFLITFFGIGVLHGLAPILTAEAFPTRVRYSGAGISYSMSAIVGGMLAPAVLAALIGRDVRGHWFFVPALYVAYCVVALAALWFVRETRSVRLEQLDATVLPGE